MFDLKNIVINATTFATLIATTLFLSELLDAFAQPRRVIGFALGSLGWRLLTTITIFGLVVAATGNPWVGAIFTIALSTSLTVGSNLKRRLLGEPLSFSDLAVLGAFLRYPGFYLSAIPILVRASIVVGGLSLLAVTILGFVSRPSMHIAGLVLALSSALFLAWPLRSRTFMSRPNLLGDVATHGLALTLVVYWWRWRVESRPSSAACPPPIHQASVRMAELVIVVQCESFADPLALKTGSETLPGLARARACAFQWGHLIVSGFGAYTMRTEYGVLFGQEEAALGFRAYDPFLTAERESAHALPMKLKAKGYRCLFLHPHDPRFYSRDRLVPVMGFDHLIGEEACAPPTPGTGPYVSDAAVAETIARIIGSSGERTFLYAVTMENHGPWAAGRMGEAASGWESYLRHLRHSDAMLVTLMETLAASGRSAVLAFFGDHRPSIPGAVEPGGDRHTPYVLLRFNQDDTGQALGRVDLTPAQLHHAILAAGA